MSSGRPSLCDGLVGEYSLGLHVGGIFVVLFSSLVGTGLPIVAKFVPFLRSNSFFFAICKTAATGVLLSVSAIHLINDAVDDFLEPCINKSFSSFYSGYALLFAFVAALLMHAVDLQLAAVTERWMRQKHLKQHEHAAGEKEAAKWDEKGEGEGHDAATPPECGSHEQTEREMLPVEGHRSCEDEDQGSHHLRHRHKDEVRSTADEPVAGTTVDAEVPFLEAALFPCHDDTHHSHHEREEQQRSEKTVNTNPDTGVKAATSAHLADSNEGTVEAEAACDLAEAHGHSHAIVLPPPDMSQVRRVIAAICMEFGVSLHSVFVGLDVGLTTDHDLKPLLIAIVFHQLFEGVSLGSRLVDADFTTTLEVVLAVIFAISAPIGMVAATIAISVAPDAMSGGNFVLMMAVLSAFCGGILLYLAFSLLFTDFAVDVRVFGGPGHPWRRLSLFVALWTGFLVMAIVGKWL